MNINVTKDNVVIDRESFNTHKGEYNVTECLFTFSEEYDDLTTMAIFTKQSSGEMYQVEIVGNRCDIPNQIFENEYEKIILGVYGYDITESGYLKLRQSPAPDQFIINKGSFKVGATTPEILTPTQYEIYANALRKALQDVENAIKKADDFIEDAKKRMEEELIDCEEQAAYAKEQGDYAKEQGNYAKNQGDYAKTTTNELKDRFNQGEFNGATFTPSVDGDGNISWTNDKGLDNPQTQNIKGDTGETPNLRVGNVSTLQPKSKATVEITGSKENPVLNFGIPKGDTYNLTRDDKEEIAELTTERAESKFNEYYNGKVSSFDKNASDRTNDFDSNAASKTNEYNDNANSKVESYNTNASEKVEQYNTNASTKLSEYNTNASNKVQEYNDNANERLDEYNENADELISKTGVIGGIVDDIVGLIDRETSTGTNTLSYDKSKVYKLFEGVYEGNDYQESTEGKQLLNKELITPISSATTITQLDTGIRVTNNTNGYGGRITINNLKENTDYYLQYIFERIGSTGTNRVVVFEGTSQSKKIKEISGTGDTFNTGSITTVNIWFYVAANSTGDASYTDIVLSEGTAPIEKYEKYSGGNPSPNPEFPMSIETLKGYNLFDESQLLNASDWTKNDDGYYNGTFVNLHNKFGANTNGFNVNIDNIKQYTLSFEYYVTGGSAVIRINYTDGTSTAITLNSTTKTKAVSTSTSGKVIDKITGSYASGGSNTLYIKDMQLVEGTIEKPYLPYNSIGIKRIGKNLCPKLVKGKGINASTGLEMVNSTGAVSEYIEINFNESSNYIVSGIANKIHSFVASYDDKFNFVGRTGGNVQNYIPLTKERFNSGSGTKDYDSIKYLRVYQYFVAGDTGTIDDIDTAPIQLEKGSTQTEYEPYQEKIDYIDLQGNELLSTDKVVVDVKSNVKLVKNWKKVILNSDNAKFSLITAGTSAISLFWLAKQYLDNNMIWGDSYSQYYQNGSNAAITANASAGSRMTNNQIAIRNSTGYDRMYLKDERFDNETDLNNWIIEQYNNGNPVEIYIPIEPIEITIGTIEPIRSLEGTNNVEVLSTISPTSMSETYAFDTKAAVKELQEAILNMGANV